MQMYMERIETVTCCRRLLRPQEELESAAAANGQLREQVSGLTAQVASLTAAKAEAEADLEAALAKLGNTQASLLCFVPAGFVNMWRRYGWFG